ncbi:hypothetical protein [Plantactinospora sp. CA-290183]|uniref:hypothetical protein n=1 Tax=Plantactinospora sp. CA-290183 TaxID=3240006 RepID=UPI003D8C94FE
MTFYTELRPISDDFVPAAPAVSGLDRDRLLREAPTAEAAMTAAARWGRGAAPAARVRPAPAAGPHPYGGPRDM